ncbi:hypothetical protein MTP99_017034 [Tenebrio molitor]|nr:hypothetical protein MTP99_017034 [Tenebrio molitor]
MLALESLRRPWLTDVHFNNTTALATTSDGGGVTSAHSGRVLPVSVIFRPHHQSGMCTEVSTTDRKSGARSTPSVVGSEIWKLRFSSDHGEDTISTLERDGSMRGVAWQTRMRRVAAVKLG